MENKTMTAGKNATEEKTTQDWGETNILGQQVEVKRLTSYGQIWFCAYANLKNSKVLSDSFLGYTTLREGDLCGVDTAHAFNEKHTEAQKLWSALGQIESVIKAWKEAIGGKF